MLSLQRKRSENCRRASVARLLTIVFASLLAATPGMASANDHAVNPPGTGTGNSAVAMSTDPNLPIAAGLPRPLMRPPLPFTEPQVGPVIKRTLLDDIENRTTAFLPAPEMLSSLTPIDYPDEQRWIRVDLSEQMTIVYEQGRPIRGFVISSGLPRTPTVLGEYRIRTKVRAQTMSGGSGSGYYNLPNVQWVQYFYSDYSFHGTYWHSDFGQPKSHGCINMTNADAKWLFDWAGPTWDGKTTWYRSSQENPGTLVIVHE